jgi:hypothetical protein
MEMIFAKDPRQTPGLFYFRKQTYPLKISHVSEGRQKYMTTGKRGFSRYD